MRRTKTKKRRYSIHFRVVKISADEGSYLSFLTQDGPTNEQRMEEGRRMFQVFAARMFEQRVLAAYREKVARERQQRLIQELEEEDRLRQERELKKQREKERKKDKKRYAMTYCVRMIALPKDRFVVN